MVADGYKQTDVGVIPEDWKVVSIDSISKYTKGFAFKSKDYKDTGVAIIRISDISGYEIDNTNLMYLDADKLDTHKKWLLKTNDLIVSTVGSKPPMYNSMVGKFIITTTKNNGSLLNQNAVFLRTNDVFLSRILLESSKTKRYISYIEQILRGNANQANITIEGLLAFQIAIPSKESEQQAIATALSDTDELINSLEKLISKKEAIKTGTMQELLTGKKRLDGFSGTSDDFIVTEFGNIPSDWKSSEFQDVLAGFSSGMTPYRGNPEYYKGNIKWITSGELNYNVIYDTIEHITLDAVKKTNLKILPEGTFLMAITGLEAAGTRGSCGIVGQEATTNQSCMAIYGTKKLSIDYLYHFYVRYGNFLAFRYCQGTKQQSYTAKIAKILPIIHPESIDEQKAIATVLSDMDINIKSLKVKLSKVKAVKEGMMQELLTGRTRLLQEVS